MLLLWSVAALGATVYCIARAVVDFRQRMYVWSALGIASAAVFVLTPIQTHAVKVDLPVFDPR